MKNKKKNVLFIIIVIILILSFIFSIYKIIKWNIDNNKTNKIIMDRISLSIFVLEGIMNKQELNKLIGKNVKKYRLLYNTKNKNKITQVKLSEMLGVHMSLIAALESDNSTQGLSIYNLYQISKILNVRIDKFFEGVD